jgi:glycosyltransferase involved in cell wall biosynthesis
MSNAQSITVAFLVKNEPTIAKSIKSVIQFPSVSEVLVWDTGSTDDTLAVIESTRKVLEEKGIELNVKTDPMIRFCKVEEDGIDTIDFAASRNRLQDWSKNDWILTLDADEILVNKSGAHRPTFCVEDLECNIAYGIRNIVTSDSIDKFKASDADHSTTASFTSARLMHREEWKWSNKIHNTPFQLRSLADASDAAASILAEYEGTDIDFVKVTYLRDKIVSDYVGEIQGFYLVSSYVDKGTRNGRVIAASEKTIFSLLSRIDKVKLEKETETDDHRIKIRELELDVLQLECARYEAHITIETCKLDVSAVEFETVEQTKERLNYALRKIVALGSTINTYRLFEERLAAATIYPALANKYRILLTELSGVAVKQYSTVVSYAIHSILMVDRQFANMGGAVNKANLDNMGVSTEQQEAVRSELASVINYLESARASAFQIAKKFALAGSYVCPDFPDFNFYLAALNLIETSQKLTLNTSRSHAYQVSSSIGPDLRSLVYQTTRAIVEPISRTFFPKTYADNDKVVSITTKLTSVNSNRNIRPTRPSKTKKRR